MSLQIDEETTAFLSASSLAILATIIFNLFPIGLWEARLAGNAVMLFILSPLLLNWLAVYFMSKKIWTAMLLCADLAVLVSRLMKLIPNNPFALNLMPSMKLQVLATFHLERFPEADALCQKAIKLYEKQRPRKVAQIAELKTLRGSILASAGNYDESEKMTRSAIADLESSGAEPFIIFSGLAELAASLGRQGQIESSIAAGKRALEMAERVSNSASESEQILLAMTINNLAVCYEEAGFEEIALDMHKRSLKIRLKFSGEKSQDAMVAFTNVGYTQLCLGINDEGLQNCKKAMDIASELGLLNTRLGFTLICNYGSALLANGKIEQAEKELLRSTSLREKAKDGQLHENYHELGKLYREKGDYSKSQTNFDRALSLRENRLGKVHPLVGKTLEEYSKLLVKMNRENEAKAMAERAESINAQKAKCSAAPN